MKLRKNLPSQRIRKRNLFKSKITGSYRPSIVVCGTSLSFRFHKVYFASYERNSFFLALSLSFLSHHDRVLIRFFFNYATDTRKKNVIPTISTKLVQGKYSLFLFTYFYRPFLQLKCSCNFFFHSVFLGISGFFLYLANKGMRVANRANEDAKIAVNEASGRGTNNRNGANTTAQMSSTSAEHIHLQKNRDCIV